MPPPAGSGEPEYVDKYILTVGTTSDNTTTYVGTNGYVFGALDGVSILSGNSIETCYATDMFGKGDSIYDFYVSLQSATSGTSLGVNIGGELDLVLSFSYRWVYMVSGDDAKAVYDLLSANIGKTIPVYVTSI